jgi:glycosyltransferase involved in cell wall biosynthesis
MVRVFHIISGDLWAGAEVMAYNLLKELIQYRDLELSAIILNEGKLVDEIRRVGISVNVIDERTLSFFQILSAIKKIFKNRVPNLIHSHRYKENLLAYLASRTVKDIKLIGTLHGMPEASRGKGNPRHRFISMLNIIVLSKGFQYVVAVSKDLAKAFVKQYGLKKNTVKVIHNGIEIPEKLAGGDSRDFFVIGSAGRFFGVKGYPLMVDIANQVVQGTTGIRFELAGDGPELGRIHDLIQGYGLERCFLLRGFVDDVSNFYRGLDLYLNTSLHEGIPLSVLEAMAHGLPVVAPSVGGLKEILQNGVQGYLVESRNPGDFAEKCLHLYNNRELVDEMSSAARERIMKEFSIEAMARQYHDLYMDGARN